MQRRAGQTREKGVRNGIQRLNSAKFTRELEVQLCNQIQVNSAFHPTSKHNDLRTAEIAKLDHESLRKVPGYIATTGIPVLTTAGCNTGWGTSKSILTDTVIGPCCPKGLRRGSPKGHPPREIRCCWIPEVCTSRCWHLPSLS